MQLPLAPADLARHLHGKRMVVQMIGYPDRPQVAEAQSPGPVSLLRMPLGEPGTERPLRPGFRG
ncbi:MAG: hypothetical protein A3H39_11960 [candidate division NC10 bacterium RIFCSPLOWO2_02_FULL_66_22]|nr:MAG: hypothetical protein A3H39_11960 [candidate division NC10 bacterium RIFCSPLOWO2_02_FULL_66_22]